MVQNIYALTTLQEGMLFHSLLESEDRPYFEQMILEVRGDFDVALFEQSWNHIVERYDVFRTIFVHKNTPTPKQVVLKSKKIEYNYEDIRAIEDKEAFFEAFIKADKARYFEMAKKPPLRVSIFQTDTTNYRIIFAFHHIIMDGWSGGVVFGELFSVYEALKKSLPINLPPITPYSHYVKWLQKQDKAQTKSFWQNYLQGYSKAAKLPALKTTEYQHQKHTFHFDKETTDKLNRFVKDNALTLNVLMQVFWGIIVAKLNNTRDVVFGATVSGRVDEIPRIETMVGLFINAIPVRVAFDKSDTIIDVCKKVMRESIEAKNHHYYSLADIQNLTALKEGLIEQLMVFENYPVSTDGANELGFEMQMLEVFNQTNYNFDITIEPNEELGVMFKYNSKRYPKSLIDALQKAFEDLATLDNRVLDSLTLTLPSREHYDIFITSTFTHEPIESGLKAWGETFDVDVDVTFSGYNQLLQDLVSDTSPLYRNKGINVLLIRFEDRLRFMNAPSHSAVEEYFNEICTLLESKNFAIPTFIPLFKPQESQFEALYQSFELKLKGLKNIYTIDFSTLHQLYHVHKIFDAQSDMAGHIPFSEPYFFAMGSYLFRKIYGYHHPHFKVIALDCDNTLWQGVVGEDGAQGVKIEGGYALLQQFMIARQEEGFLLVLNSKNNENDVWEVFETNEHMLLQKEHIVHAKINWQPKSQNLKQMASELNLGLNSFLFVDDNPLECSEVIKNAPEVLALPLPKQSENFKLFLEHLWALDKLSVTAEDKERTKMYQAQTKRDESAKSLSMDEFLASLELKIYMNKMFNSQLERVAQLTQRTNQFNISTIRRSESEIQTLLKSPQNVCWSINVEDKFGDYGLVGVVISTIQNDTLFIDTFLMSCRVLGRGVERTILAGLKRYAMAHNLHQLVIDFYPTKKNQPARDFISNANFTLQSTDETKSRYVMEVEALNEHAPFVTFLFDQEESIFAPKATASIQKSVSVEVESHFEDDFSFDFLQSVPSDELEALTHKKFYEPLKYHKASDSAHFATTQTRALKAKFIAPASNEEQKLARIFQTLLSLEKVGIDDCFFESGGHSLSATRLLSQIYQAFNVELELKEIFANPTIRKLLLLIKSKENSTKTLTLAPNQAHYPLSNAQKRVWLLDKMGVKMAYNMPIVIELKGALDINALHDAFVRLIARHEILRTYFIEIDDTPYQKIASTMPFALTQQQATLQEVHAFVNEDAYKGFDLGALPLFRVHLFEVAPQRFALYFNMHHSISDGWSLGVITQELSRLYNGETLPPLAMQYKDYAYNSAFSDEDSAYWLEKFDDEIEPLEFPLDFTRPKTQTFAGEHASIDLSSYLGAIERLNKKHTTTAFMLLTALTKVMLSIYSNQRDIIVGFPISGRERIEFENQIGFYANTLALRDTIDFKQSFEALLLQVKETILHAHKHQNYPFEALVDALNLKRDLSRSPIFDIAISLSASDESGLKLGDVEVGGFDFDFKMAQFDMSFDFYLDKEALALNLTYNSALFKASFIKRFLEHFTKLLDHIESLAPLKAIELGTPTPMPTKTRAQTSIIERFKAQVAQTPDAIALNFEQKDTSYQALERLSDAVANYLKNEHNIQEGDVVPFLLDRSDRSVIAMLAILKLNATFLPLNSALPAHHLSFITQECQAKIILDAPMMNQALNHDANFSYHASNNDLLAYIIYTSGTTGNPKGVEVSQRALLNLCDWYIETMPIRPDSNILLMIPTSFDASIKNILAPLFVGAKVVVAQEAFDPFAITTTVQTQKISLINCVPSAFKALMEANVDTATLQTLAFGGEALHLRDFTSLRKDIALFNIYGPTEACDITTCYRVDESAPIGYPIPNTQVYLLDEFGNVVPDGVVGELHIAGAGLANGYLNNPKLTQESFIQHKFGRLYRTGDLAKVREDGAIEFMGRKDEQVKINGNRIELHAIEHALSDLVTSAVVLVKENQLIAYIQGEFEERVLREVLKKRLVSYMVPTHFVKVDAIKLTKNGKIDKKALLALSIERKAQRLTPTQQKVAHIFSTLLSAEFVDKEANFFEIGGNSLNAIKLMGLLNKAFNTTLSLASIFEYPSVVQLAHLIDTQKDEHAPYRIYNKGKAKTLCIFPSILHLADDIFVHNLAKILREYQIYSFGYKTPSDYAQALQTIQADAFLGYSTGGALAFEVIKRLKNPPQKLILLDSHVIEHEDILNQADQEALHTLFEHYHLEGNTLKEYITFINSTPTQGSIKSDITLIRADSNEQSWQAYTSGHYEETQGFGTHDEMVKESYLNQNAKIIQTILEKEVQ